MSTETSHKQQIVGQFTQQAEGYARLTGSIAATDRQAAFRALVQPQPLDRVLDVCCGPGTVALDLAPFVARVTGIDLTHAMLRQARAAQAQRGVTNAEWMQGDVLALPFDAAAFSLVTCGAAFHHITDPRAAFAELARVCCLNGKIVIRDVTPAQDKSAAYDRLERLRDPSHTHALTPEEMSRLGDGLPVNTPSLHGSVAADLPLDAVLATSFPELCGIADIRAMLLEDALSGNDQWGFAARLIDGEIRVSYPQTTAIWVRI